MTTRKNKPLTERKFKEMETITIGLDPEVVQSCELHHSGQWQVQISVPKMKPITAEQHASVEQLCGGDDRLMDEVFELIRERLIGKVLMNAQQPLRY